MALVASTLLDLVKNLRAFAGILLVSALRIYKMPFLTLVIVSLSSRFVPVFFFSAAPLYCVLSFHLTNQFSFLESDFCDKLQMFHLSTLPAGGLLHVCCGWNLAV